MRKQPDPIDIEVGARIRIRRRLLSISQKQLAAAVGVTFQQIQKYETGRNRIGSSRLQMIADVLSVSIGLLFDPDNDPKVARPAAWLGHTTELDEFLGTKEGRDLNKAFAKVCDPNVRLSILTLVTTLAEGEEMDRIAPEMANSESSMALSP